jgi:16S rRNA (guanine1207-N2)-methyltransferase
MRSERLRLALETGVLALPEGDVLVTGASAGDDLSALPRDRVTVVQGFRPDHDALAARGFRVLPEVPNRQFAGALVCLPRAREAARAAVAAAAAAVVPGGPVAVDGQKDDGIDTLLRELKARVALGGPVVKAHGRLAVFAAGKRLADWAAGQTELPGGWITRPGVFSADGPDRGSVLLAEALPSRLKGKGVDLGAGWGYLARAVLARDAVARLDLVEADHAALACARRNVTDPRAVFHWADATVWKPDRRVDFVVMNPPFHRGRAADPALGTAFLAAAARALVPDGTLWLVANRGLPYDRVLQSLFREVEEIGADASFRLTRAARPMPPR